MRCDQNHLLGPFLDGELPAHEAARVRGHLSACPTCAAEADELRALSRLMAAARRSATLGQPTAEAMDRLRAHVRGLVEQADTGLVWMARIFSGVAASVLVGGLWLLSQPAARQVAPRPVAWDTLAATLAATLVADSTPAAESPDAVAGVTTRETVLGELMGEPLSVPAAGEDELP